MTLLIDGRPVAFCQACGESAPATQQREAGLPDNGIRVTLAGWYGGFSDEDPLTLTVCHDCALRVFRVLNVPTAALHQPELDWADFCCAYSFLPNGGGNIVRPREGLFA